MPLVDIADYVDGFTELKALCGHGLHKTDPMATMGISGLAEFPQPYYSSTGISGLGCGGDCPCAKCRGVSGLGDVDFSGIGAYKDAAGRVQIGPPMPGQEVSDAELAEDAKRRAALSAGAGGQAGAGGAPGAPTTEFGQKVDVITNAIAKVGAAFGPLFQKAPREKVVVHKDPDYTAYAVIGGAVIVASMLAIAVGKSGRKG